MSNPGIPDFAELSDRLHKLTGWTVAAVPELTPEPTTGRLRSRSVTGT